jgi:hypothetical protein
MAILCIFFHCCVGSKVNGNRCPYGNDFEKSKKQGAPEKQFLFILDGYIKSREAFGMMTSGREKDELIAVTRSQVSLL